MAKKRTITWQAIVIALAVGVVASVLGALVYSRAFAPRLYLVQITPIGEGQPPLRIEGQTVKHTPNQDGILFVQATITAETDSGPVTVEVQPKDENVWYKQQVQEVDNRTHVARIQLGSKEWPIRGGEGYLLRASSDGGQATARITIEKAPSGSN